MNCSGIPNIRFVPFYKPPSFLNSDRRAISSLERNDSCILICSSFDIFIPLSSGRDRLVRGPFPVIFFSPTDERRKEIYINNLIRLLGLIIIRENDVSRKYFMKKWLHLTFDARLDQVEQVKRDARRVEIHIMKSKTSGRFFSRPRSYCQR